MSVVLAHAAIRRKEKIIFEPFVSHKGLPFFAYWGRIGGAGRLQAIDAARQKTLGGVCKIFQVISKA